MCVYLTILDLVKTGEIAASADRLIEEGVQFEFFFCDLNLSYTYNDINDILNEFKFNEDVDHPYEPFSCE